MTLALEHLDLDTVPVQRLEGLRVQTEQGVAAITDPNIGREFNVISLDEVQQNSGFYVDGRNGEAWRRRLQLVQALGGDATATAMERATEAVDGDLLYVGVKGLSESNPSAERAYKLEGVTEIAGKIGAVVIAGDRIAVVPMDTEQSEVLVPLPGRV